LVPCAAKDATLGFSTENNPLTCQLAPVLSDDCALALWLGIRMEVNDHPIEDAAKLVCPRRIGE